MSELAAIPWLLAAALAASGFAAGAALGLLLFGTLRWTVGFFVSGGALRAAGLQILRFAAAAGGLLGLAQLGAAPLIAALAGILIARQAVLWRSGIWFEGK